VMQIVPLEMPEILENSTIVGDALDNRRLTSRRNRPPLLRSDGVLLPDRERLHPSDQRNMPFTVHNVSSSALRSEAINHSVDEGLSNFRSQHARLSVARPDFTRFEGMMAQMQEMERALLTDGNDPNPLMIGRFERASASASHEIHSSNLTHRAFLEWRKRNRNASIKSKTRSDFTYFDRFVSSEFPLPSYQEALILPGLPKYSINDNLKKSEEDLYSVYRINRFIFYLKK